MVGEQGRADVVRSMSTSEVHRKTDSSLMRKVKHGRFTVR